MRIFFSITFALIVVALIACIIISRKSKKENSRAVAFFLACLIPPVIGNLFIIASDILLLSTIGFYIYFVGMDFVVYGMARFTYKYCGFKWKYIKVINIALLTILLVDIIQILVNIHFGNAFAVEMIHEYDSDFYRIIPFFGQTFHRILDYTIIGMFVVLFVYKTIATPRVYAEKYFIILVVMIAIIIWESIYIFTRTPIDRSMIGFGVFGLLVFFFTLYYRPLRLLDRLLAALASKMPESLCFFDTSRRCIWINAQAAKMLGVNQREYEKVSEILKVKFEGISDIEGKEWKETFEIGEGRTYECYEIEKHEVSDDRGRPVGSFLSIRDVTVETKNLQRETYNANHDALTGVLNRAGYNTLMDNINLSKCFLVLFDLDSFKQTNDVHGHEVGDKVLVEVTHIVKDHFRDDDNLCRIGGDEFAVVLQNVDNDVVKEVEKRVKNINDELAAQGNGLPTPTISVGGAFGKNAENSEELFNNADHALYQTKFSGKRGFTLFESRQKLTKLTAKMRFFVGKIES